MRRAVHDWNAAAHAPLSTFAANAPKPSIPAEHNVNENAKEVVNKVWIAYNVPLR